MKLLQVISDQPQTRETIRVGCSSLNKPHGILKSDIAKGINPGENLLEKKKIVFALPFASLIVKIRQGLTHNRNIQQRHLGGGCQHNTVLGPQDESIHPFLNRLPDGHGEAEDWALSSSEAAWRGGAKSLNIRVQ
ncbi:MAG: hypothetical protein ACO27O_03855 [Hylemonella sp.]